MIATGCEDLDVVSTIPTALPNRRGTDRATKAYLVGGGIVSLAAAALLIRDGDLLGRDITILEECDRIGGSLNGCGSLETGDDLRGGWMIEIKYLCTYDLFSSIPTLDDSKTVTQEIFDWEDTMKPSSKARLVRGGRRETAPKFGLSEKDILTIECLAIELEFVLGW